MSAVLPFTAEAPATPRQNWILSPAADTLFVVAAPLLVLAAAIALFAAVGAADATAYIVLLHVVLTVAHHLPTFIRVYGDVDLFKRFKWTFVLAPVFPLAFAATALTYLNARGYALENVLYLWILLALWDPWHFLMQHYGFTRIYDRHNAAPKKLASRMDFALSATWFTYIMLASGDWLAGIFEDLFLTASLPAALALPVGLIDMLTNAVLGAAVAATIAYGGYLVWCRCNGYYVSAVKLALYVSMFGVMFLAYTPNEWILSTAPGWTFAVGFAVIGVVHMTQYLAIVWSYNRRLAAQGERARGGVFRALHRRGGGLVGAAYVALCLGYGATVTTQHDNALLASVLLAIGFTSTLLHYYFDGFIWKIRHRQNREGLDETPAVAAGWAGDRHGGASWWSAGAPHGPVATLARQALYFGVPLAILSAGALVVLEGPGRDYTGHMLKAQQAYQAGRADDALGEARAALASIDWQLPLAARLAELRPTAERESHLAFLTYNGARYREILIPQLIGEPIDAAALGRYRAGIEAAIDLLQSALDRGGAIGRTSGDAERDRADGLRTLAAWRKELL